jgi:hypothetical protein
VGLLIAIGATLSAAGPNAWAEPAAAGEAAAGEAAAGEAATGEAATGQTMADEASADEAMADVSYDGLQRVETPAVAVGYVDPAADFSVFRRVVILDPLVAFRSNWQRDQNRGRVRNVTPRDADQIKTDVAGLFKAVLTETLEADDGYEVVDADVGADYDVLVLRPAIVDLDVTAPDVSSGPRSRTYSVGGGSATLVLELVDSVSGDTIARAIDRQATRRAGGRITWTNRVTNQADARRVFRGWAETLRDFLDSQEVGADEQAEAEPPASA